MHQIEIHIKVTLKEDSKRVNETSEDDHTIFSQQLISALHSYQPAEQIYTPPDK